MSLKLDSHVRHIVQGVVHCKIKYMSEICLEPILFIPRFFLCGSFIIFFNAEHAVCKISKWLDYWRVLWLSLNKINAG